MLDSDILTYHAIEVSGNSTNGGRRSYNQIISGVVNNVWPHVTKAERLAGSELYRFLYILAGDTTNGTLISAEDYLDGPTAGDDHVISFAMAYGSTQANITGSERKYGSATISTDAYATNSTFDVTVEDLSLATGTDAIYLVGDKIRITDKVLPSSVSGNEEYHVITAVSNSDTIVTITISGTLANDYLVSSNSKVSSVIEKGDVKTSSDNYVIDTAGDGDFDHSRYPMVLDNLGTEKDSLTFTFTDATHFTCTGTSGNPYGSGTTGADFSPVNSNNGRIYFTLEVAGFNGTWAGGDTLSVDIEEASFLTCLKRIVPVNCASLANNKVTKATTGESDS